METKSLASQKLFMWNQEGILITVHFNKRTATLNYLDATFRKVCKIHTKLPSGGILAFLTGKRDIEHFCDKVRKRFDPNYKSGVKKPQQPTAKKKISCFEK